MRQSNTPNPRVPFLYSFFVCSFAVLLMGYFRFYAYPTRFVAVTYSLPLLLCLWNRDKTFLWGMSVIFSVMAFIKLRFYMTPESAGTSFDFFAYAMMLLNIWIVAVIISYVITIQNRLEEKNEELLAERDKLSQSNTQLLGRESVLQLLFDLSRRIVVDFGTASSIEQLCRVAVEAMQGHADAAAILEVRNGELLVRGHYGFGPGGPKRESTPIRRPFAAKVVESGKTEYIKDIRHYPELIVLQPAGQEPYRAVLAAPLTAKEKCVGVLKVFSTRSQEWSNDDIKMIEWLSAQASLLFETFSYRQELAKRHQEAEESSKRKTRFLAAVSHDVRTPANAISLLADLIGRFSRDTARAGRIPELAGNLKESACSLIELVSDVLDLARFDSGRLEIDVSEFSLAAMIQSITQQHLPLAESKQIALQTILPPVDAVLATDKMKLTRVLNNLVGNAVKFTEQGSVRVRVRAEAGGEIDIDVHDTGIGIPPEHIGHIFDEFFQLRNQERDRSKGTGLGLAICKHLADGLGCKISVASAPGEGATFTVRIPAQLIVERRGNPATEERAHVNSVVTSGERLRGLKVLLVEDHSLTRSTAHAILEAEGAEVRALDRGDTVLHAVSQAVPDVVLLDLMLPDIDGCEVLEQLKRFDSRIRVITISGDVTPQRLERVRSLGADMMMSKPIHIEELISKLLTISATAAPGIDNRVQP